MVANKTVHRQLRNIGHRFRLFGRAEVRELPNILQPSEKIVQCAYGYYQGGSGLLVLTDKRLLLIDKRPFYLNLESLPFEHIRNIDFGASLLQGNLYLHAGLKKLVFRSISDARLRNICEYIKEKIDSIEKPIFSTVRPVAHLAHKPYLNPAWRPHHITFLPRTRPSKYHNDTTRTVTS